MTATRERCSAGQSQRPASLWLRYLADAGLLIASGLIHLYLWNIAYRHVATLDYLFLVQVAACRDSGRDHADHHRPADAPRGQPRLVSCASAVR
jgi:hypothetical protein